MAEQNESRWSMGRLALIATIPFLCLVGVTVWMFQRDTAVIENGPMIQLTGPDTASLVFSASMDGIPLQSATVDWTSTFGFPNRTEATLNSSGMLEAEVPMHDPYMMRDEVLTFPMSYTISYRGFMGIERGLFTAERFVKRPLPDEPFSFLAFGDSGNGSNAQFDLADKMLARGAQLIIHTGDVVYPGGYAKDYPQNFYRPYQQLLAVTPFMPSPGNHDFGDPGGQAYFDNFVLPTNGPKGLPPEHYYWFDYGNARFVSLDTNLKDAPGVITEEEMRTLVVPWLRETLNSAEARWKFVFFHHPPYTGAKPHPANSQKYVADIFVPVFEECGVSVVFCGHNHLYERSHPMKGGQIVAEGEGVRYITTGAGGANLYEEDEVPPEYIQKHNDTQFSFTDVLVRQSDVLITQWGLDGTKLDEITIPRPTVRESREPANSSGG